MNTTVAQIRGLKEQHPRLEEKTAQAARLPAAGQDDKLVQTTDPWQSS